MLNRLTLGFLLLGQLCLVGCDEINVAAYPPGFAIVEDGWLMVGQENGDQATFVQLDQSTGVAEELMSPAFYLPLSWDIQAEARSWESTCRRGALRKRFKRRGRICGLPQQPGMVYR